MPSNGGSRNLPLDTGSLCFKGAERQVCLNFSLTELPFAHSDLVAAWTYLDLIYRFWVCLKGFSIVNLSFCVLPKWRWESTIEIHNLRELRMCALELKHLYTVHPFSLMGICNPDMSSLNGFCDMLIWWLMKMRVRDLVDNEEILHRR